MSGVGVPVVVDCVQQGVASDLGRASRDVVDVVALHGNHVVGASQVDSPVVVAVAGCAPACVAVELAVGERHAVGCRFASDEHLAADEGHLDVVNPDQIGSGESDGVAAPDVLGVELGDVDVLDNHVCGSVRDAQTLAPDHTCRPNADDGLVAADIDARDTSLIVRDGDGSGASAGVTVRAPARLVDGVLAPIAGAGVGGGAATSLCHATFGADVVVLLVQDNDTGGGIGEPGGQLGDVGRVLGSCAATTGCAYTL